MSADAAMPGNAAQHFGAMLRRLIDGRQWERVLETARQWLAQEPENADAHLAAGQALVNLQQYPAAEVHIMKVLAARPNHGFALRLASIACFNQQKTAQADELIRRAIDLQPNDAMHWYQLALMRYQQGLMEPAEKYARRALELQPRNANTINLIAICQRGNPSAQLAQYLTALEIDPENAVVHTNLGAYYLNTARDYAAAEASFRRALQCDPSYQTAQHNLFVVLRLRDPIYRVLTWPRTLLRRSSWARRDLTTFVRIALLLLWLAAGRYVLAVFAFWLMLIWPLVKAYEYLTISDIRAKAGIAGARSGGWKNFHRWPLWVRLGIFLLLVVLFWGMLFWLYASRLVPKEWLLCAVFLGLLIWYGQTLPGWWKRRQSFAAGKRAEKSYQRQKRRPEPY